jgi:hypothetical protein
MLYMSSFIYWRVDMYEVKLFNVTTGEKILFLFSFGERDEFDVLEDLCEEQELLHPGTTWNAVATPIKPVTV